MNAETIALITLSGEGAKLLAPLAAALPAACLYVHETVAGESIGRGAGRSGVSGHAPVRPEADRREAGRSEVIRDRSTRPEKGCAKRDRRESDGGIPEASSTVRFSRIADLTASLFPVCRGLVYAAPCGVVVRSIAPLIRNKYEDPAVVVLDAGGRWAVSLLSGHEGGANSLAIGIANLLGAEPVVTTTTEALKSVIVGIGCRRGTPAERIVAAVQTALFDAGVAVDEVRLLASAGLKADEEGLLTAAEMLGIPIRFVAAAEIRACSRDFSHSDFVKEKVNLPAVAEPAALLAGRRTRLICRKKRMDGITIALARESFSWWESAPEAP